MRRQIRKRSQVGVVGLMLVMLMNAQREMWQIRSDLNLVMVAVGVARVEPKQITADVDSKQKPKFNTVISDYFLTGIDHGPTYEKPYANIGDDRQSNPEPPSAEGTEQRDVSIGRNEQADVARCF